MRPNPMVFRRILPAIILFVLLPVAVSGQQNAQQTNNVPVRITQAIDNSQLTRLKGNTHPLALPEFDRGPAPSGLALNRMLLVLQRSPAQEAALEDLIDQQQEKFSPNYHVWLTPDEFGQQFGPADQDIQTITAWLQSQGFQVNRLAKGRIIIEFSGTAGQVKAAFHTEIHKYNVNGKDQWANSTDPQIPSALVPVVAGVASLNNFPRHPMNHLAGIFTRDNKTGKVTPKTSPSPQFTYPCGTDQSTGQAIDCYPLGPYDFATIYDLTSLWTAGTNGSGQHIGIVAETDINPQDFADFHTMFGQTNPAPVLNVIHDGPDPGVIGDEPEADIDTQWSSAVAPGVTIDFVVDESTETTAGVDLSAEYIVDNNLDPVMSESYGSCELALGTAGNAYLSQLWQQAAAQGITVMIATGDSGSAVCDRGADAAQFGLAVSGQSSTPYNVAVGGTDFNDLSTPSTYWNATNNSTTQSSALSYIPEMTWNDSCTNQELFAYFGVTTAEQLCNNSEAINDGFLNTVAGSGGASNCTASDGQNQSSCAGGYAKPAWQKGSGVPNDGERDVPDVSLFASNGFNGSFYIVCQRDLPNSNNTCDLNYPYTDFGGYGGTSVSSPAFAGIMALVNQKYGRQGNANYVLYGLASQSGVFHDIPAGSTIAMPCVNGSPNCTSGGSYGVLTGYSTTTGYDLATGLGSVDVANLVNKWPTASFTATTTSLSLSTAMPITHGASVSVSGTVKSGSGSGTPTGTVSLIAQTGASASNQTDVGTFNLSSGSFSGTTNLLPGGTNYQLIAHYPGDSTFGASNSTGIPVTVNPENSKTVLSIVTFDPTTGDITNSNATSFPYGSPYLMRADITNSSGSDCFNSARTQVYACPTGTVSLTSNGTALGSGPFALNAYGFTEYQTIQLTGGSYTLGGSYSGDHSYNASTGSDPVTVTPASTTTSITSPASSTPPQITLIGGPLTISVKTQSNSSGVAPTANQQSYLVFDGTTQLTDTLGFATGSNGSPTAGAWVGASLQTSVSTPPGTHSLTVKYNGDTNYASSTSSAVTVDAVYADTLTATANPANVIYGQNTSVTVTATLDTTNPASNAALKPTGAISFGVSGTVNTTVSQDASGNWMMQSTIATVPQQSETLTVTYPGDSNYASATQSVGITVTIPDFTISAPTAPLVITAGQSATATITIAPTTNYTSTVALSCSGLALYGETCSISPTSVALSNGAAATVTLSMTTVAPSSTTSAQLIPVSIRRIPSIPGGRRPWWSLGALTLLLSLALLAPTPRRRFAHAARALAAFSLVAFLLGCGGGGGGNGGGGGGNPMPTTTTISVPSTKFAFSQSGSWLTLTATVKSSNTSNPPSSGVTFTSPGCSFTYSALVTNGAAQAPFPFGMPGTCTFTAKYNGDAFNLASQSGALSVTATGNAYQGISGQTGTDTHTAAVNLTLQ